MTISNRAVLDVVRAYLEVHPEDERQVDGLVATAEVGSSVVSRENLPGHVACGAVAISEAGAVLEIRHIRLDRWLPPGGHVEAGDPSLRAAAQRELLEETGIGAGSVTPLLDLPVDIEPHDIPENPARGEPAHVHYDLTFIFLLHGAVEEDLTLQESEVSDWRWLPLEELGGRLGDRVRTAFTSRALRGRSPGLTGPGGG